MNIPKPNVAKKRQKVSYPRNCQSFKINKDIHIWKLSLGGKWTSGNIVGINSLVSYQISTEIGLFPKHVDQLRKKGHYDIDLRSTLTEFHCLPRAVLEKQ